MHLTTHTAAIRETLAELARTAAAAGDTANANALNRAAYQVARGALAIVVEDAGDLLVPSKSDASTVYRVDGERRTCTCTAGQNGKPCWHSALWEGMQTTRERAGAWEDSDPALDAAIAAVTDAAHGMSDAEYADLVAEQGPQLPAEPWAPDYILEIWP